MHKATNRSGFTIVELLVVIVVIGVLAAITIVSYSGISSKAVVASVKSDLGGSAKKLEMYLVENSDYPTSLTTTDNINYCPTPADTRYCLKASPNTNYVYIKTGPQSYSLEAKHNSGESYFMTNKLQVQSSWMPGVTGSVLENKKVLYQNTPIGVSASFYKWADAVAACQAQGGRLPTITELQAIASSRALYNDNFYNGTSVSYWSSTESGSDAWRLIFWIDVNGNFSSYTTGTIGKTFNLDAARCVKD